MASNLIPTKQVLQQVRPLLSVDKAEARRRVLHLYKAWMRAIPEIVQNRRVPKTEAQCREKLREMFLKNKDVTDIRVIDMLVIKGKQHLDECASGWAQPTHTMRFWGDTLEPKPADFLSKFISGKN